MKVGDTIYCKRDLEIISDLLYKKDNCYLITNISNIGTYHTSIIVRGKWETKLSGIGYYEFSLHDKNDILLFDYFYTEKELRKLKLNKIDESR